MRVIAVLGALFFGYLAVIPAALVGATLDPGCTASSCGYAPAITVYLVAAFGACSVALAASAVALAAFAARPSSSRSRLVGRSLAASATAIGLLLLSEFALGYPVAAAVVVAVSVGAVWLTTGRAIPRRHTRMTRR